MDDGLSAATGAARGLSKIMILLGSLVMLGCVGYLMIGWWDDRRWFWIAVGVVVILANIGVLIAQFRPTPKPRDWTLDEVRELIEPIHGETAQIRTLRRADKGLGLVQAVELVRAANTPEEPTDQ
ncbi:hypothetical protein [Williamsia sp. CHRR-6]|uniref:hypothetical protein n=1 Tax=Williamsia sp. CHRR-6 TaxID=2835871 RepID=UPI001BDA4870|nr:hypothetical protein [Williamsia sp. CHRR-6]MBT0567092.1 hypothetical protein [Williamsia sp. CHRR-6]